MSQSLSQIWIHLVFSTKNRTPFLSDQILQERVHKYLATLCLDLKCPAKIVGGYHDHVHILCLLEKGVCISDLVRKLKACSSKWINKLDDHNLKDKFEWQNGYSVFSVSQSMIDKVNQYILNQNVHHQKKDFKEELLILLQLNKVAFNEQFLWQS